jgi:hypothetical protein
LLPLTLPLISSICNSHFHNRGPYNGLLCYWVLCRCCTGELLCYSEMPFSSLSSTSSSCLSFCVQH